MITEVFTPELPATPHVDENRLHDQVQQFVGTITTNPEFSSLLERFDTKQQPFQRTVILQGVYRASLAIDLMHSMQSEAIKEKLLRQLDAHQIPDPMFQRVILGVTRIASHRDSDSDLVNQRPSLDKWSQVSVLREAKQIDSESLYAHKEDEFDTGPSEGIKSQAEAFEEGYELVIKQYQQLLLTDIRSQFSLTNGNS